MKQEKNNIQELIQKTNDSVQSLKSENQAYFDDLIVYMASSSLFHDEEAIREQLYQMVLVFRMLRRMESLLKNFSVKILKQ